MPGHTAGPFGKVLNDMVSYGCDNISGLPPGVEEEWKGEGGHEEDYDYVNDKLAHRK